MENLVDPAAPTAPTTNVGDRAKTLSIVEQALATVVREASRPNAWIEVTEEVARASQGRLPQIERSGYPLLWSIARLGTVRPSSLADRFGMDLSTVSRQLSSLEKLGLIERGSDPVDRRASTVALSPIGTELLTATRKERARHLQEALSSWDDEDLASLARLLNRFARTMSPELYTDGETAEERP